MKKEDNSTLIYFQFGVQYLDADKDINLFFIIDDKGLISPITGKYIRNLNNAPIGELVKYHIKKHSVKGNIPKQLPNWLLYAEAKSYKKNLMYDNFTKELSEEFMNYGYSDTLLQPQDLLTSN